VITRGHQIRDPRIDTRQEGGSSTLLGQVTLASRSNSSDTPGDLLDRM